MTQSGRDSSFDAPTLDQAKAAFQQGVTVWGGYFGSRPAHELGLAVLWNEMSFWNVQQAGMTAIGFCSGFDNPDWIKKTGQSWGILPCVDVEPGIRVDGLWVRPWVQRAGSGLYGLASVHYHTGEPIGRGAAFNVVARYPSSGCSSGLTWDPAAGPRPAGPCGWQCQGDHSEFGLSVDSANYDDWFAPKASRLPDRGEEAMGGNLFPYPAPLLSNGQVDPAATQGLGEVYCGDDRQAYWAVWYGAEGMMESYDQRLTTLGSPEDAKDLVEASATHHYHAGVLRMTAYGTRQDGNRWFCMRDAYNASNVAGDDGGWKLMPSTPKAYVPKAATGVTSKEVINEIGHTLVDATE